MKIEFRKGKNHTNEDMPSRTNCGTCTQCLIKHENAKKEKPETQKLHAIEETNEYT